MNFTFNQVNSILARLVDTSPILCVDRNSTALMKSDAMPRYAKWTMVIRPRNWKGSHSDLTSNQNEAQVCHWGWTFCFCQWGKRLRSTNIFLKHFTSSFAVQEVQKPILFVYVCIYVCTYTVWTHDGWSQCTIWSAFTFKSWRNTSWCFAENFSELIEDQSLKLWQGLNHVKSKHERFHLRLLDRMFAFHGVVVRFPVAKYLLSFFISFLFIVGNFLRSVLGVLETFIAKCLRWGIWGAECDRFSDTEWAMIFWFNVLFGHSEFVG